MKSDKIEKLKKQKQQLEMRIKKMEALEKQRERKRDTRRKILIGSYYIKQAVDNNEWSNLVAVMDKFLKRDSDRTLFNLPPIESDE